MLSGRPSVPRREVERHLARILQSSAFSRSGRLREFLEFSVVRTLEGDFAQLKESIIGIEVFRRPPGYDPKTDAIVRVEAQRLRRKLEQYYAGEGAGEPLRLSLPKGGYAVTINPAIPRRPTAGGWRRWIRPGAAALAVVLTVGILIVLGLRPRPQEARARLVLERLTSDAGVATDPVPTADGRWVVFSSDRGASHMRIWRVPTAGGPPELMVDLAGADATEPDVSPDGRLMAFHSNRAGLPGIVLTPAAGGPISLRVSGGARPRFSPDGKWILYHVYDEARAERGKIYAVPVERGEPVLLAPEFADAHNPVWSDDGGRVLFCGTRISNVATQEHDWWVVPFNGALTTEPARKTTVLPNLAARMGVDTIPPNRAVERISEWSGGYVYFTRFAGAAESLWRIRLTGDRWPGNPEPERLTFGAGKDVRPRIRGSVLVFSSGSSDVNVFLLPAGARSEGALKKRERLTSGYGRDIQPALSPDGARLAFARDFQDQARPKQIRLLDMNTRRERPVSVSRYAASDPVFSPDGREIAFALDAPRRVPILVAPADGGAPREICANCGKPQDFSPDGRRLLLETGAANSGIEIFDLGKATRRALLQHGDYPLRSARYSPDGRWVAFYAEIGRETRIYVGRADAPSHIAEWIPITDGAGPDVAPAWSRDGTALYYIRINECNGTLYRQKMNPAIGQPEGRPEFVWQFPSPRLGVSRLTPWHVGLRVHPQGVVLSTEEQSAEIYLSKLR